MLAARRTFVLLSLVALLATALVPALVSAAGQAKASKAAKRKRKCKKGYAPKTVRVGGKRVKRCRKVEGKAKGGGEEAGAGAPADGGTGTVGGGPAPLFEPPGQKLEGEATKPFLERYLVNSTFTDCPAGWPNCSVEQRYSHTGSSFYYCRLTSVQGADIINGARAYQVQNAVVEADGSWTFNEVVDNYGSPSYYEWHVGTDGVVTGAYQYNGTEQIGPLQYVSGARDCSY